MRKLLFTVEDVFSVTGRGVILVPGFREPDTLRLGQAVVVQRPDGTEVESTVAGMDLFRGGRTYAGVPLLLRGLTKEEVPVGSTVWTVAESAPR